MAVVATDTHEWEDGGRRYRATLTVERLDAPPGAPAPTGTLTLSPETAERGRPVTLSWRVQGADEVWLGGVGVDAAGSVTFPAEESASYTLEAGGPGGAMAPITATLTVTGPDFAVVEADLPAAREGRRYGPVQLRTRGAAGGVRWAAFGLPEGLSLSPSGVISGVPLKAGEHDFVAVAADLGGEG